jgi:hypothetical protein
MTVVDLDFHKFVNEVFDVLGVADQGHLCRVVFRTASIVCWPIDMNQFAHAATDPLKFLVNPWKVSGVIHDCAPDHWVILSFGCSPNSLAVYMDTGNHALTCGRRYSDGRHPFADLWRAVDKRWSSGVSKPRDVPWTSDTTWLGTPVAEWTPAVPRGW